MEYDAGTVETKEDVRCCDGENKLEYILIE